MKSQGRARVPEPMIAGAFKVNYRNLRFQMQKASWWHASDIRTLCFHGDKTRRAFVVGWRTVRAANLDINRDRTLAHGDQT